MLKQGLLGEVRFIKENGVLEFIRQVGCIQFDPIDICGKNAEIILQSRVGGFTKSMLNDLLYEKRKLIDYFDKNLSIIPIENWPLYNRMRIQHSIKDKSLDEINQISKEIIQTIAENGPMCSKDFNFLQKVDWYWNETRLSRASLEHLYFSGVLLIHHKKNNTKYYDLVEKYISEYKWEIYTPKSKRKYGCYVLPILYGEKFIGRIEITFDRRMKEIKVKNIWLEPDVIITDTMKKDLSCTLKRFEAFNKEE
ncbi:crosslink repair DNA glycosylase YcaQ family protein [Erysipelotrichaceae bacterium HCN-30851]